jgi:hypothetical protein
MSVWSWAQVAIGIAQIAVGLMMAFARKLPGPAWLWGRRDVVTGAPTWTVRVSGTAAIAMGGGFLALACSGSPPPSGISFGQVLGLFFLGSSIVLYQRAARLRSVPPA